MNETVTKEVHTERRHFIGSSDAAAVLGLSRWGTPLSVWSEKTGALAREDISKKLHIRLGHRLEQVVAELFTEETGLAVAKVKEIQVHEKHPYLCAQIDRRVVGANEILECKTASGYKADEWQGDDVPAEYIIQCLHQLAVTGKDRCYIACLIGGNQQFVWKIIERDEDMIAELVAKEVEFWEKCVVPKIMPAVSAMDAPTLLGLFPMSDEKSVVELPDFSEKTIFRYKEIGGLLVDLASEKEELANKLKAMLGDSAVGTVGNWRVAWPNQSTGVRLDLERIKKEAPHVYEKYGNAGQTRVLRITDTTPKAKGKK